MKKILFTLLFYCTAVNAQKTFDVVSCFYQGAANNCASIALIKSAMIKYGYKTMFECHEAATGYKIKLKDGTEFVISRGEETKAKDYSKFEITESRALGTDKDSVVKYAYLAYAVIAKSIAINGYYGCDEDGHGRNYRNYANFDDALRFISKTSFCTDYCLKILGYTLSENRIFDYNNPNVNVPDGAILYSWGHAVVVYNNMLDCHGDWMPVKTNKVCYNKFEWYVIPE